MREKFACLFSIIVAVCLCGCGGKSLKGFYVSQNPDVPSCLEFKSNGKVIVRDLSSLSASVDETTYTVDRHTVRIHEIKLGGNTSAVEFSLTGDTLISANGFQFKKDTSGKTYTPAERLAEAKKTAAEAEQERLQALRTQGQLEEKERARRAAERKLEQEKAAAQAADRTFLANIVREQEEAESKAKTEKENAKRFAAEHLPAFTNLIVTLTCNDNTTFSNIALISASLDGLVYRITNGVGGGLIPYTQLDAKTFEDLHIDTNIIEVAEERSRIKAELDRQYNQMLAQEGAAKANEFRRTWNQRLTTYSAEAAFARRYGLKQASSAPQRSR
jgi:hypothetical protein